MAQNENDKPYDAFLSHAREDGDWCERLATRLRDEGVRVWFDRWELRPGDNLLERINEGLKQARKLVAVFSRSYFGVKKEWTRAEAFAQHSADILSKERPLIPLLLEDCAVEPTLRGILHIDFRNDDDFDLRLRQLVEALDLPRHGFQFREREEFEFREHKLDPAARGRQNYAAGKRFEDEVATLYRLLGFDAKQDSNLSGMQIDLTIEQKVGGLPTSAIVECKDKQITAKERDQILAQRLMTQQKLPAFRTVAVSAQGFAAETRTALEAAGVHCITYAELLRELVPLDSYVDGLVADYEEEAKTKWQGDDWFIRPDLVTDIVYEKLPALTHVGKWLGDERRNQMVILGDLGTGKTTLASFLAYQLARSFHDDPLRHPAPVLIPLKDVRKEETLESVVSRHFQLRGLRDISFPRFEHLVRLGKVVLLFDAFDEMADRVRWDVTQDNFRQLSRLAEARGKIVITCRTHYFKDRTEQVKVIGEGPTLSETETELYRDLRQRSSAEVVYLQEFNDDQIKDYLKKARPQDHAKDWQKIQAIYNLKDLATRPLLLDMIVKSLPRLKAGQQVNAANLYNVYTNIWIDREDSKGRKLSLGKQTRLALMLELGWRMWRDATQAAHFKELCPFIERLVADQRLELGDEEAADIAVELQSASFLKRDNAGNFTFMHRSFGEFFLARRLQDCLADPVGLREMLNTRRYDQKTIYFLALLDEQDALREPLQEILRAAYQANVSENALQILYWSARIRAGMEEEIGAVEKLRQALAGRVPPGAQLAGAQLQEAVLESVDLTEANLAGADLTKAKLGHAVLDRADLRSANLTEANTENARLAGADYRQAVLIGVTGWPFFTIDTREMRPVVQLGATGSILALAYSSDGKLLAECDREGMIRLYRASDGMLLQVLGGGEAANAVAFAPDGATLASGGGDGSVKLWQVRDGTLLRELGGHSGRVNAVAFAPNGATLASGGGDGSVKLWQVRDGKLLRKLTGHSSGVRAVAFAPDGATLASSSDDNSVKLWQVRNGALLHELAGHSDWVRAVAFAPDGATLASGDDDGSVKLWQVRDGAMLRELAGHLDWVTVVAFAPDGATLASSGGDGSVKLWQVRDGTLLRELGGHSGRVNAVAFAPNGATLASGGGDGSVKLWQVRDGTLLRELASHSGRVNAVAFAPDGATLASGGGDGSVKLWQVRDGKLLRKLTGHSSGVRAVAFAPDGATLASSSDDNSVKLWQVRDGKLLRELTGHSSGVRAVAFAPDGATLASSSDDNSVKLWQVRNGSLLRELTGHSLPVKLVAFAPDGLTLASGSADKKVRLWQVRDGKLLREIVGHSHEVSSVVFAPDGLTLASGSADAKVRLWQVCDGKLLCTLAGNLGSVEAVAFAPNGKYLVAAGAAGRLQFWDYERGETFLYRYSFGPGAWLDLLPDGRFDGSPEGMRYLGYTAPGQLLGYRAEELVKEFYDPEAVRAVLAKYI